MELAWMKRSKLPIGEMTAFEKIDVLCSDDINNTTATLIMKIYLTKEGGEYLSNLYNDSLRAQSDIVSIKLELGKM